ncbi:MAG: AmmeMemoRadiSam system protein B [Sterolibacterium sp.]|nr:AmmeMemoRadiSam system protein B [Sterolibacterium sp.]
MDELSIRSPAVAGMFYPGSLSSLANEVNNFLAGAGIGLVTAPKALIVPHAGYVYSGAVAASAYACVASARDSIRRVVLLGPTHRVAVRGLALPMSAAFATPLGQVPLDTEAMAGLLNLPQVQQSDAAHALEHSLEVQLPFLQTVLKEFKLIPLAVGMASDVEVAEVLDLVWGGTETLIVISSDLSHYHPYADAQRLDRETARQIVALHQLASHEQACGATPVNGLLLCARQRGLKAQLLDLRNSGDTAGDRSRVVGYGAFALIEEVDDVQ